MVRNRLLLIGGILLFLSSCASVGVPEQFAGTLEGVCNVWRAVKPHYPALRALAIDLHDAGKIDAKLWGAFVEIDKNAAQLDRALVIVCTGDGAAIAKERWSVNWDAIGANVLRVAAFAIESGLIKANAVSNGEQHGLRANAASPSHETR